MFAHQKFVFCLLWAVVLLFTGCTASSPTDTIIPTATSSIPPALSTVKSTTGPTSTPTITPSPTQTSTPRVPVIAGTNVPQSQEVLTADNIAKLTKLAAWGYGAVQVVTLSDDGTLLAVGTTTGIWIYDGDSLEKRLNITTPSAVLHVAFSPDGQQIACGEIDGLAHIYRVSDGEMQREFSGLHGNITGVAFSPDGRYLMTSDEYIIETNGKTSKAYQNTLWEVGSGAIVLTFEDSPGQVAFTPDGQTLAAIAGNQVEIWDVASLAVMHQISLSNCANVQFSPDGAWLAVSCDGNIRLYNPADGAYLNAIPGDGVVFSTTGNFVLSVQYPNYQKEKITLWTIDPDTATFSQQYTWTNNWSLGVPGGTKTGQAATFSPDGQLAAVRTEAGIDLYSISETKVIRTYPDLPLEDFSRWVDVDQTDPVNPNDPSAQGNVFEFRFTPDGQSLWQTTGLWENSILYVRFWDVESGAETRTLQFEQGDVTRGIAFSPDGTTLATGSRGIRLFSMANGDLLETISAGEIESMVPKGPFPFFIGEIYFSPDGQSLILRYDNALGLTQIWELYPPKLNSDMGKFFFPDGSVFTGVEPGSTVVDIYGDISTDGSLVARDGPAGRSVEIVRASDFSLVRTINLPDTWGASDWEFSPDGTQIAVAMINEGVSIWEIESGALLQKFDGISPHIAFSPDGSLLALQTYNPWIAGQAIYFYRVSDGTLLHTIQMDKNLSRGGVAFSPDGTMFAASFWGSVHVWGIRP